MSETESSVAEAANAIAGLYLTFELADETCGIQILKVQEIIAMMQITTVPQMPPFVRGIINLRGRVIPVIDLRRKFELEPKDDTEKTCVIVVEALKGNKEVTTGLLVDEVAEVLEVKADQIEPPPSFGAALTADFILGVGKVGEAIVMLLDADKVVTGVELAHTDSDSNLDQG